MKALLLGAAAAMAITGAGLAQDFTLNPNFGSTSLSAGFLPDPFEVSIAAGGSVNASGVGCAGMISQAPDYRLQWNGGRIKIGARASQDTTLVINAPNGQWFCSDDVNGLDPELVLSGSGQYDIWVGTFGGGIAQSTLYITEY
ncbi:MAG: peptidase S1 [Pseudomonadota bacterium]